MITGLNKHLASSRFNQNVRIDVALRGTTPITSHLMNDSFFITQHPCLVEVSVKCEGDLKAVIGNLVALTANSHFFSKKKLKHKLSEVIHWS